MNRFLLVVIALLLILGLVGLFTSANITLTNYAEALVTCAENLGIIMLMVNGTFVSTWYFKISIVLIMFIAFGAVLKIMHYPGGEELLLFPFPVLWLLYFIHFIFKKTKNHLDILKLIMLLVLVVSPLLEILHYISFEIKETLVWIGHILFWVTFTDFIVSVILKKHYSQNSV